MKRPDWMPVVTTEKSKSFVKRHSLVLSVLLAVLLVWFFGGVEALQKCVEQTTHDHDQDYFTIVRLSVRSYTGCVVGFAEAHNSILLVVGTVALAIFTYTLWRATSGMQEVTTSTLDHLGKEFVAEHRPWVTLDCKVAGALRYDGTLWRIPIKYSVTNIGRSPATNVSFHASLFPVLLSVFTDVKDGVPYGSPTVATDAMYELEGVCTFPEVFAKQNMGWGQILFPAESDEEFFNLSGNPARFDEAAEAIGYSGQLMVAACVSYGATFNTELYRTAKAFLLYKGSARIDPKGEVLPITDLGFTLQRSYAK